MAKFGDYPAETIPNDSDLMVIKDSDDSATKRITRGNFLSGAPLPADTVDTQAIEDEAVTPAKLVTGTGTDWEWASWTPTLVNLSGGTLNYAKYKQIGKTVHYRIKYTLAGAGVASGVTFTPPVALDSDYGDSAAREPVGIAIFRDASTGSSFAGTCILIGSSTAVTILINDTASSYGGFSNITSTIPFTWASGDTINISGSYEAA